jgi:hypothetical protein
MPEMHRHPPSTNLGLTFQRKLGRPAPSRRSLSRRNQPARSSRCMITWVSSVSRLRCRRSTRTCSRETSLNLAEFCGKLTVSVKGEAPQNLDKSKLENGVYEPLREADLIE